VVNIQARFLITPKSINFYAIEIIPSLTGRNSPKISFALSLLTLASISLGIYFSLVVTVKPLGPNTSFRASAVSLAYILPAEQINLWLAASAFKTD
jgi:hypothetical protein